MASPAESGGSSIQKGAAKGGMSKKAVAVVAGVLIVAGAAGAFVFLGPKGGPSGPVIVHIDGSSTVFPITSAWAGDFNNANRQVVVAFSGTGGGFQKWCRGETDLSDASRPISSSERALCATNNITGITDFQVAYDGLSLVVPLTNTWAQNLTVKQICRIWTSNTSAGACGGAGPHVTKWIQLNASWPDQEIKLYGPGTDSGTFDYFREVILTKYTTAHTDQYFPSEDDNILVQGVSNDMYAMGYFGFAYVAENANKIRPLAVDDQNETNGAGAILPTHESIRGGTYKPLGRPIYVYANADSLAIPVVKDFLRFGFSTAGQAIVEEVGYIGLTPSEVAAQVAKIPA